MDQISVPICLPALSIHLRAGGESLPNRWHS